MYETTLSDLRQHCRRTFDRVEQGETVRVLRNGRPIAEIVPIRSASGPIGLAPARPLTIPGVRLSGLISDERAIAA